MGSLVQTFHVYTETQKCFNLLHCFSQKVPYRATTCLLCICVTHIEMERTTGLQITDSLEFNLVNRFITFHCFNNRIKSRQCMEVGYNDVIVLLLAILIHGSRFGEYSLRTLSMISFRTLFDVYISTDLVFES